MYTYLKWERNMGDGGNGMKIHKKDKGKEERNYFPSHL
jgi:hypothetical protein